MACEALKNLDRFDEAVHRCSKAQQLAPQDGAVAEALKKAQAALKQSKEKNYYKILGVARDATVRRVSVATDAGARKTLIAERDATVIDRPLAPPTRAAHSPPFNNSLPPLLAPRSLVVGRSPRRRCGR